MVQFIDDNLYEESEGPVATVANAADDKVKLTPKLREMLEAADLLESVELRGNPDRGAVLIDGANHVFNTPNPMPPEAAPSPQLAQLIATAIEKLMHLEFVGELGVAAVHGLQGELVDGRLAEQKVFATLKHMTGHGQPESGTNAGPSPISERELRAFASQASADVESVGGKIVGRLVPMATVNGQGRAFTIERFNLNSGCWLSAFGSSPLVLAANR